MEAQGGFVGNIDLVATAGGGIGVVATKDLPEMSPLLAIPPAMQITAPDVWPHRRVGLDKAFSSDTRGGRHEYIGHHSPTLRSLRPLHSPCTPNPTTAKVRLAINGEFYLGALLACAQSGRAGLLPDHLQPYLRSLPLECVGSATFTEAEMASLNGTSAETQARSLRQILEGQWGRIRQVMLKDLACPPEAVSDEALRQGICHVQTRVFAHRTEGNGLMPILDLFNHHAEPEVTYKSLSSAFCLLPVGTHTAFFNFTLLKDGRMAATTIKPVVKGQQLHDSYGNTLTTGQLVARYGFMPDHVGYDNIPVTLPSLPGDPNGYYKVTLMQNEIDKTYARTSQPAQLRKFLYVTKEGLPSKDIRVLRLINIKPADFSSYNVGLALSGVPVNPLHEKQVAGFMAGRCKMQHGLVKKQYAEVDDQLGILLTPRWKSLVRDLRKAYIEMLVGCQ
eukprot:gene9394-1689_t